MPRGRQVALRRTRSFVVSLLVAVVLIDSAGCTHRAYDGPRRDAREIAVVRHDGAAVKSVDGRRVGGWFVQRVELLPGSRTLGVQVEWSNRHRQAVTLPVSLSGGTVYRLRKYETTPSSSPPPPPPPPPPAATQPAESPTALEGAAAVTLGTLVITGLVGVGFIALYTIPYWGPPALLAAVLWPPPKHPPEGHSMRVWVESPDGARIAEWESGPVPPPPRPRGKSGSHDRKGTANGTGGGKEQPWAGSTRQP